MIKIYPETLNFFHEPNLTQGVGADGKYRIFGPGCFNCLHHGVGTLFVDHSNIVV
jgi:hypothetical protein